MSFWLELFVVEVRKLDGTEYPSKSIYLILCGLHRHLRENGIYDKNFLDEKNVYFARFRKVLNDRMRTLNEKGLGLTVKRADPILPEQEDNLWEKGVFGQGRGDQLQLTIFFYACKLFGLRTRDDHHLLTVDQFSVGEDGDGRFVKFVGRSSKTDNKGESGLLSVQSKSIKYYSKPGECSSHYFSLFQGKSIVKNKLHYQDGVSSPSFLYSGDRCIIDMFGVYLKAVGEEGSFYRRPLPPEGSQKIRFAQQSLGINKLKNFMKVIAERGELKGNFTILSGTRTGDMHQRHVLKDFQNKKAQTHTITVIGVQEKSQS